MDGDVAIRPARDQDLEAINEIYNREVLHGTATWDYEPWSLEQRRAWFAACDELSPVLVAEIGETLAGYAYLSRYRARDGYRFTREDTVYVAKGCRGRGVGKRLLTAIVDEARRRGLRSLVAAMSGDNEASLGLHRAAGFQLVGVKRGIGYKFGRWLDLTEMYLVLQDAQGLDFR